MKEDASKDFFAALAVFLLCMLLDFNIWMKIVAVLPLIFFVLYFIKAIQPSGIYIPPESESDRFVSGRISDDVFTHGHPIIMPKPLYFLQGLQMYFFGICFFWIPPVCRFFMNWGKTAFRMMSANTHPLPAVHKKPEKPKTKPSGHRNPADFVRQQTKEEAKPDVTPAQAKKISEKQMAKQVAQRALREIEANHKELAELQKTTQDALASMFEGSELTQNRFMQGVDDALKMSQENLEAARKYLKIGTNPEIMQTYLNRSRQINQSAGELIDALVKHQQGKMEDNLNSLNNSLDELQESLKYYR